jgi:hypothetical protein
MGMPRLRRSLGQARVEGDRLELAREAGVAEERRVDQREAVQTRERCRRSIDQQLSLSRQPVELCAHCRPLGCLVVDCTATAAAAAAAATAVAAAEEE